MEFGYVYETGKREHNEDALLLRSSLLAKGELVMVAVCDGMGGMEHGKEASYLCIRQLEDWYEQQLIPIVGKCGNFHKKLQKAIRGKGNMLFWQMNRTLFKIMRKEGIPLGTTATVCIFYREMYFLFHIGDSKAFTIDSFLWSTQIHSLTKVHGDKRGLSRCLGLNKEWKPDFLCGKVRGKIFLLCTDGFWRKYDKKLWKRCLNPKKLQNEKVVTKRLKSIADYNMYQGEQDNISACLIKKDCKICE